MSQECLAGSLVAAATPFADDGGAIAVETFAAHIAAIRVAGNQGVVVGGTTGEGAALTDAERRTLLETALEYAARDFALVAATSAMNTSAACRQVEAWKDLNLAAVLATVPPYVKPSPVGVAAHFGALASTSKAPVIIYNIPHRVGIDIAAPAIAQLAGNSNICGVKDSSGDPQRTAQQRAVMADSSPNFALLCGEDSLIETGYQNGCNGMISVIGNIVPALTAKFARTGSLQQFTSQQAAAWRAAITLCGLGANPEPVKWALHQQNPDFADNLRLPMVGLQQTQISQASKLLKQIRERPDQS